MVAAVSAEWFKFARRSTMHRLTFRSMTPISCIVSAYHTFLDDEKGELYGKAIECSAEKHFFVEELPLANGAVSKRAVTVWEPLFKMSHHELSGLPDAIP